MDQTNRRTYWRRLPVAPAGLLVAVPAVLVAAVVWAAPSRPATPSSDPATMWLASANGTLVRANALVDRPAAQIVESMPYAAARSGVHLLPVAGGVVVVGPDGRLSRIRTATHQVVDTANTPDETVVGDGARLYGIGDAAVAVLDPDRLTPTASHPTATIVSSATGAGGLYVATADAVVRIDGTGAETVNGAGAARQLAGVDGGVAAYDPAAGTVSIIHGTGLRLVRTSRGLRGDGAGFAATPDGRSFAAVLGGNLVVSTPGGEFRRPVHGTPGTPVLTGDRVYLADQNAGRVHVYGLTATLPEQATLDFGTGAHLALDVHRTPGYVWLDDVRGPIAYAVGRGTPREVVKYTVRPHPAPRPTTTPPTATSPTTTPPTSPPASPPTRRAPATSPPPRPHPAPPAPSRSRSPSPSPSPSPSRSPSRSPSADPRARCHGDETRLSVHGAGATGDRPQIDVRVCVPATGGDEYWIVAHAEAGWFAKKEITGTVSDQTYTVELLNGSGATGEHRSFLVVAGRTGAARQWLQANLDADRAGDNDFPRGDLPDGIDKVSASVPSTS